MTHKIRIDDQLYESTSIEEVAEEDEDLSNDFLYEVMLTAQQQVLKDSAKAAAIISSKFDEVFGNKEGKK